MRICIDCGRRQHDRPMVKTHTVSPDAAICITCAQALENRLGRSVHKIVGEAIDNMMVSSPAYKDDLARIVAAQGGGPRCGHCGEPVLITTQGTAPMWCDRCEQERRWIARTFGEG